MVKMKTNYNENFSSAHSLLLDILLALDKDNGPLSLYIIDFSGGFSRTI